MIGFSVFLCKEKIAIIKRKEKGACRFEQQYIRGKKDRERNKRLIFTAVSILLEIVFLLFLFTKVSEYATIIDWATRIVAIFLVLGLYSMDKTSSMKMPWIITDACIPDSWCESVSSRRSERKYEEDAGKDMKRLIKNCSHIFRITDRFSNG